MRWGLATAALALALLGVGPGLSAQDAPPNGDDARQGDKKDLSELSIEELMQVEITSASKKSERLLDTPAAVYVIRSEDILRSGATSIPEALRMAPGMEVAHIDSNKWAISARGFNDLFSNKLLVLMDGRSVYNPTFSGVYWDVQDLYLQDIDRIEVIRGPGGTIWGANAVDGVVNVISKSARDTQGGSVTIGGGTSEQAFSAARYGAKVGDDTYYRVYAKWFERDDSEPGHDGWQQGRTGFRLDWLPQGPDAITFQGDFYRGYSGTENIAPSPNPPFAVDTISRTIDTGGNLLGRWVHTFGSKDALTVQGYYDRADRAAPWIREQRDTLDLDVHYRFPVAEMHDVTLGAGYRWTQGKFGDTYAASVMPSVVTDQIANVFLQDEMALIKDTLTVTAGCKLEYNNYTHLEVEPTIRARWTLADNQTLWGAVSRGVRTPSPAEVHARYNEMVIPGAPPTVVAFLGSRDFKPESVLSTELGYRLSPTPTLSFDLATYYNDYANLRSIEPGAPSLESTPPSPHVLVPFHPQNLLDGRTYGVELASQWQIVDGLRMSLSYTYFFMDLTADPGSQDNTSAKSENGDPSHQFYGRLSWDPVRDVRVDVVGRYVDALSSAHIPSYFESDVRAAWQMCRAAEVSLVGQNLAHRKHAEEVSSGLGIQNTKVERGLYAELTISF